MGKKVAKSTKNFAKKHLNTVIKQRKSLKPVKNALKRKAAAAALRTHSGEEETAVEEESGTALRQRSGNLSRSEVSEHNKDLDDLKEKDPEFYEFLQGNAKELLNFNDDNDGSEFGLEEDEDDGGGPESMEYAEVEGSSKHGGKSSSLSMAVLEGWIVALREKHHTGALTNVLKAFRTACHYGDGEGPNFATKYNITSSHVFNKVLVFVLREIDGIISSVLSLTNSEGVKTQSFSNIDVKENKKWKRLEPLVKAYLGNALHILNQMTDNQMISFTIRRVTVSIPFLRAFPKLARKLLKLALHYWGSGDGALSAVAFLCIRDMALQLGEDISNASLKGMYHEYAINAKFVNAGSLGQIHFRANCVLELYGLDLSVSYQLAFVFIRQMAIILRNATTVQTKTAYRSVYCWQYINSLHLWVKMICMYPGQDELRPLLYPVAQILSGVVGLVPNARYFPLHAHCVKMMNDVAMATSSLLPIAPLLLRMLHLKDFYAKATGGVGKAIDLDLTLKIPKPMLKTRALQEECVATVLLLLSEHLAQWSYSVAFPELAVAPLIQLRQFLKKTGDDWSRRKAKDLVDHIERNIQFVWSARDATNFSPKDSFRISAFLQEEKTETRSPLSQFVVMLRKRVEERRSFLRTNSKLIKEVGQKKSGKRSGKAEDPDTDDDELSDG